MYVAFPVNPVLGRLPSRERSNWVCRLLAPRRCQFN